MNQFALSLFIFLSFNLALGQAQGREVEVPQRGDVHTRTFETVKNELSVQGLKIKVIPVDVDTLTDLFYRESQLNGAHTFVGLETTTQEHFAKMKALENPPSFKGSDYNYLIEGLDWLKRTQEISEEEYYELKRQILTHYNRKKELQRLPDSIPVAYNPYYVYDKQYLSVFKVQVENTTNAHQLLKNQMTLEAGPVLLACLSKQEISTMLRYERLYNASKELLLNKFHMPDSIRVPPGASFEKFIAFSPLPALNAQLTLAVPYISEKMEWAMAYKREAVDKSLNFREFEIRYYNGDLPILGGAYFSIVKVGQEDKVFIQKSKLLVEEGYLEEPMEILALCQKNERLFFQRNQITSIRSISDNTDNNKLRLGLQPLRSLQK